MPVPPGPNGRPRQPNADSGLESLGSSLGSSAPLHKLVLQEEEETPGLRKEMAGPPQVPHADMKHQSFYIISFNILCECYPLEIGLIEYTNAWSSMGSLHTLIEQDHLWNGLCLWGLCRRNISFDRFNFYGNRNKTISYKKLCIALIVEMMMGLVREMIACFCGLCTAWLLQPVHGHFLKS